MHKRRKRQCTQANQHMRADLLLDGRRADGRVFNAESAPDGIQQDGVGDDGQCEEDSFQRSTADSVDVRQESFGGLDAFRQPSYASLA